MRTIGIESLRVAGSVVAGIIALGAWWVVGAGSGVQEQGTAQRLAALESQVGSLTSQLDAVGRPLFVSVDCHAGQKIQAALNSTLRHPNVVIITVFGTCSENIQISRSDLRIRGGAPGAGITSGAGQLQHVVLVRAPQGAPAAFTLENLTVSDGQAGVFVDRGAQVRVNDCIVRNNATGVLADHGASAWLENTAVENNGTGVVAMNTSHVSLARGTIIGSIVGLRAQLGASADVGPSARIESNRGYGVELEAHALLRVRSATITSNALTGVFASGGSIVYLEPGATISGNQGSGISLMDTSLVQKFRSDSDIHITNNSAYGVVCSGPPAVSQIVGFGFQTGNISGNGVADIDCPISPGPKSQ